jgi:hypothetical protein
MIDIGDLFLHHLKSLFWGLILVIFGICLIPHEWTIKIIRFIKPSLLKDFFKKNDRYFNSILSILLDGTFTDNFKNEETAKKKIEKLKLLKADLESIEKNMFTIDLLTDLFNTLSFAAINYSMADSEEVIENIANYFSNYSNRLQETSYRKNFATDVLKRFNEMTNYIRETKEYESEDKLGDRVSKGSRKMATLEFARFLKNEKDELDKTREILIDSIKKNAIDLMDEAK